MSVIVTDVFDSDIDDIPDNAVQLLYEYMNSVSDNNINSILHNDMD